MTNSFSAKHRITLAASAVLLSTSLTTLPAGAEDERGWVEAMIEDSVSSDDLSIDIQGLDGLLGSTAQIDKIVISDRDGPWLEIEGAVLNWTRTALARKRLEVNELSANRISLIRKPRFPDRAPQPSATPGITIPSLPDLPVAIQIGKISAPELVIGSAIAGETLILGIEGQARMANGSAFLKLDLDQIGRETGFDLLASYSGESQEISLSLKAEDEEKGFVSRKMGLPGAPALAFSLDGSGPITDFTARTSLSTSGSERVAGSLRIAPDEVNNRLAFSADLGGDLRPIIPAELHDFFGKDARLIAQGVRHSDGHVEVEDFSVTARAMTLSGQAKTDTDGTPVTAQISTKISDPNEASVLLPFSNGQVRVSKADMDLNYDPSQAGSSKAWMLDGIAEDVETTEGTFRRITLSGEGPAPGLNDILAGQVKLDVEGADLRNQKVQSALGDTLTAGFDFYAGKNGQVEISKARLEAQDQKVFGKVVLSGVAAGGTPEVVANVVVESTDFTRYEGLSGMPLSGEGLVRLSLAATPLSGAFDIEMEGKTDRLSIGDPRIDPILSGETKLSLAAVRDVQGLRVKTLTINNEIVDLAGSGSMNEDDARLAFIGRLADTRSLLNGPTGAVDVDMEIVKQGYGVRAVGSLQAPGDTKIDFSTIAELPHDDIGLSFYGAADVASQDISPYANLAGQDLSGSGALKAAFSGSPDKRIYQIELEGSSQDIHTGIEKADLLLSGKTLVGLSVKAQGGDIHIEDMAISNPQISLTGSGEMGKTSGGLEAEVLLKDTALLLPDFPGASRVTARVSPTGAGLSIDALASGPGGATAKVAGTMTRTANQFDLDLRGQAPAALVNPFISPRRVSGAVDLNMKVDGPPALESLTGTVTLSKGSLSLPTLRFAARDLSAKARIRSGQVDLDVDAAPTKGGRLTASGSVDLLNDLTTRIDIGLEEVGASDPALYDTTVSGQISITGPMATGGQISGQLNIGETILRIPEAVAGTYGPIPGIIHLRESALSRLARERAGFLEGDSPDASSKAAVTHDLDIRITAPSRIYIRGRGLDAELGGQLRIQGDTGRPLPSGSFELRRGRLDLLGQRLDLTEGVLRLSGGFDPEIRLVADSITEIGTARILIEGPASGPQLELSSSPELPQDEVLSMLLFGKSVTDMTAVEGLMLANAVRTLTGGGGEGIMGKVRMRLGLDDLDLSASEDGEAQVGVGKYLADGVYANTSVTTSGETRIELNYEINEKLTARGKASSAGSAGLGLYLERNF